MLLYDIRYVLDGDREELRYIRDELSRLRTVTTNPYPVVSQYQQPTPTHNGGYVIQEGDKYEDGNLNTFRVTNTSVYTNGGGSSSSQSQIERNNKKLIIDGGSRLNPEVGGGGVSSSSSSRGTSTGRGASQGEGGDRSTANTIADQLRSQIRDLQASGLYEDPADPLITALTDELRHLEEEEERIR